MNPAGDFGSPQSLQWNYPLLPKTQTRVSKRSNDTHLGNFEDSGRFCEECNYLYNTCMYI